MTDHICVWSCATTTVFRFVSLWQENHQIDHAKQVWDLDDPQSVHELVSKVYVWRCVYVHSCCALHSLVFLAWCFSAPLTRRCWQRDVPIKCATMLAEPLVRETKGW